MKKLKIKKGYIAGLLTLFLAAAGLHVASAYATNVIDPAEPCTCHTYVSQMQALGVDIQTIQSIVGHADTEMTEHYLHVQESIRQSAIQLFSEAFSA